MSTAVDVSFDCLPLRSVGRFDIPLDASPKFRERCERLVRAVQTHGTHNTYYLSNARCVFRLTNAPETGLLEFRFEGTLLTDETDSRARRGDFQIELIRETCDWLIKPVVEWFYLTVERAALAEFDRYIEAGDLARTVERIKELQARSDQQGGFVGMYL